MYQIVRIKFQYVRIFSHPLIYQMGLSIFDLASPSYAGYLRQYQYGRKAKAIPNRTQAICPHLTNHGGLEALSRSTVQFVPVGQPRLHEPYPAILYLEQSDGYELQSLAGYLSGRVPHTGIFQVPHTRAAGVIQDGWVYLPYLFLPPIQGGDGQHSHRVLRQPIL